MAIACRRRAESYIGPGGSRRRADSRRRRNEGNAGARRWNDLPSSGVDLLPFVQRVFETDRLRQGVDERGGRASGWVSCATPIASTMNRERLMADAKAFALERVREGHARKRPRTAIPVGGDSGRSRRSNSASIWRGEPDGSAITTLVVGRALANVLAGGALPHQTTVSEQHLLDLEREAFLKLCGERKTLERMQHTLKTGKPLRRLMRIIDRGSGPPLVLVPGLQGRWVRLRPTVDASGRRRSACCRSPCATSRLAKAAFDPAARFRQLRGSNPSRTRRCRRQPRGDLRDLVWRRHRIRFAAAEPERCEKLILRVDAAASASTCGNDMRSTRGSRGCSVRCF